MLISLLSGVAAIGWGTRGLEVASWLAGIVSLLIAVLALGSISVVAEQDRATVASRVGGVIRRLVVTDREVRIEESGPVGVPAPRRPMPDQRSERSNSSERRDRAARDQPPTIDDRLAPAAPALPPAPADAVPGAPPAIAEGWLIYREAQIRRIAAQVDAGRPGLFAVLGGHGMGKSTFLGQLRAELARRPDVLVVPMHSMVSVERYGLDTTFSGEYGQRASEDVARRVLERSSQLLYEIVRDLDQSFRGFTTAVVAARGVVGGGSINVVNVMRATRRAAAGASMTANVMQAAPSDRTTSAQADVDDAFVEDWRQWLRGRRGVLIIDGFESLVDDALGQWFIQFASRLSGTVVVVPVVPDDDYAAHVAGLQHPDRSQRLTQFTRDEIDGYLARRFGGAAPVELAQEVHRVTGGHPFGLRLVTQLIDENRSEALRPGGLRLLLTRLAVHGAADTAAIVTAVVDKRRRPELWYAVQTVSLLNSFDAPLLQRLLAEDPAAAGVRAERVIAQCERLGLVEPLGIAGQFRLHDFIRPVLAGRVRALEPQRWARIHRLAAECYFAQVARFEDRTDKPFGSWFKYEDPQWQFYQSEWLFHAAQLADQRQVVRCQFLVVLLEAFWWWGMYIDFPFCHQVVETWRRAARDERDRALAEQAERFLRHYQPGPYPQPGPSWGEARRALRGMRDLCGLDLGLDHGSELNPEEAQTRRLAALYLRMFTAHTWSADGQPGRADREFAVLEPDVVDADDEVLLGWYYYEWASITIDAGDAAAAARHCRQALEQVRAVAAGGELDTELLANLHRCLGDLFHDRDPVRAAGQYGLAVRDAFCYQRVPNALAGIRNPPDHYTQRFYEEITRRAARLALASRDHPEQQNILATLVAPVAGTVPRQLASDPADVAAQLFPAGPDEGDLYRDSSEFVDRWGEIIDQLTPDQDGDFDEIAAAAEQIITEAGRPR